MNEAYPSDSAPNRPDSATEDESRRQDRETIADRFVSDDEVDKVVTDAVRNAIREHARKGHEVVVWEDGRPVWKPAPEVEPKSETA
jgi:hypothetical protein